MYFHSQEVSINGIDSGDDHVFKINTPNVRVQIYAEQKNSEERNSFVVIFTDS